MDLTQAARAVGSLLDAEGRLIRLKAGTRTIFVGDVHGDLDAVERVFTEASTPGTVVIFLGDVVDRGLSSREVLTRILLAKLDRPQAIYLLMGNHEAWGAVTFRPADFWESLSREEAASLWRP
jgi:3',5'-cyclic AMP phosphodiesterase CpdA